MGTAVRYLGSALVIVLAVIIGVTAGRELLYGRILRDVAPEQPIKFSHKLHAGDNEIPCQQCHIYARRSRISGAPPVSRCMGCHNSVRTAPGGPFVPSAEITKLRGYWEKQQPIPWVKIHDLPDYVYFPHKRHVKRGVKCQECHGPVQRMEKVVRIAVLGMGWCLECHRQKNPQGPSDCWACHV